MTRRLTHKGLTRPLLVAATLLIVVSSCGGAMSPGEYVEELNSLVAEVGPDLEASVDAYEQIVDPTMDDWSEFVEREVALRRVFST